MSEITGRNLFPRMAGIGWLSLNTKGRFAVVNLPERIIMKQTGHKPLAMVREYIIDGELFTKNAAAQVGL